MEFDCDLLNGLQLRITAGFREAPDLLAGVSISREAAQVRLRDPMIPLHLLHAALRRIACWCPTLSRWLGESIQAWPRLRDGTACQSARARAARIAPRRHAIGQSTRAGTRRSDRQWLRPSDRRICE